MKKILVTGGCGFIGHHFIEHIIKTTDWDVVVMDRLSYASIGFDRLRDIDVYDDKRIHIFAYDFSCPIVSYLAKEIGSINYIFHFGGETHVENSIKNAEPFIRSNILGTYNILEYARTCDDLEKLFYFGTDEVFGSAPEGVYYKEWDRYKCGNPYSATKAAAEELCLAYHNTHKLPIVITHCMNAFGERQHPEKFIPNTIRKVLNGEKVIIYSNPNKTQAGSRFYIHCRNISNAVTFLIGKAEFGEKYNIVGEKEIDNLSLAQMLAEFVRKPLFYEMVDFHSSRPGHDMRYALDGTKMKKMGWEPPMTFERSLKKMVQWSLSHPKWLNLIDK